MSMVIGCEPDAGYIAELIEKSRIYPKYITPVAMALGYKYTYIHFHMHIHTYLHTYVHYSTEIILPFKTKCRVCSIVSNYDRTFCDQ